jgi:hypothetical protein
MDGFLALKQELIKLQWRTIVTPQHANREGIASLELVCAPVSDIVSVTRFSASRFSRTRFSGIRFSATPVAVCSRSIGGGPFCARTFRFCRYSIHCCAVQCSIVLCQCVVGLQLFGTNHRVNQGVRCIGRYREI